MDAVGAPLRIDRATFLFTDIEGSTRLALQLGDAWLDVLQEHHRIIRGVIVDFAGTEVSTAGDSFFIVFPDARGAIAATVALQHRLAAHDWSPHAPVRVRMGLHTGGATLHDGDYAGLTVHAASRVESAAAGGQVLITEATMVAAGELPPGIDVLDLGLHRLKDLPSELQLYQLVAAGLDRDFPPVRGLDVVRNNVPVPVSNFVGRTEALAKLHRLLDTDRLVTLVGPGGSGKTRLSLRLASERLHRYKDGVWFVELDQARDDATLAGAIAEVLGVKEEPGKTVLAVVADHVRGFDVLFVLDNCEHVIDAAARTVEHLLKSGLGVRVMATSREPLAIGGERVWPVAPLSIDVEHPAASEAVHLLVDRVRLVLPEFEFDASVLTFMLAIVQRLDGLPLAIELAAASASMLSIAEIAQQLDNRFALLTRGSRTALDRQKTLWGAIDWSFELLDDEQRAFFRRLGVFPSEFDFETSDGVCGEAGLDPPALVNALVAKSLVTTTPTGRFRLLESIRAYARERLSEHGEDAVLCERHARWFAQGLVDDEPASTWAGSIDGWEVVHDDIVTSVIWSTDHEPALALEMLVRLQRFWISRGRWAEGRALIEAALDATTEFETHERHKVLGFASELALMQGDTDACRTLVEQAIALARIVKGDDYAEVMMGDLGALASRQGDFDLAEELLSGALAGARRHGKQVHAAVCLAYLAEVSRRRGDVDLAWERGNEALLTAEAAASEPLVTTEAAANENVMLEVKSVLGSIAHQRGDYATARRLYNDVLDAAREANDMEPAIYVLYCLALVSLDALDAAGAVPLLVEALTLGRDLDARPDLCESLEATARLASESGSPAVACRLLAAADGLRASVDFSRPPVDEDGYGALVADVRRQDPDAFDRQWEAGAALTLEAVVAEALAYLETSSR